mmetsp:Transcript_15333/g.39465  ORF Transcript_15333/g.39465 Transcript_15333/m.39465 type:complete len:232 (-) Transcript_15333:303-998(-)
MPLRHPGGVAAPWTASEPSAGSVSSPRRQRQRQRLWRCPQLQGQQPCRSPSCFSAVMETQRHAAPPRPVSQHGEPRRCRQRPSAARAPWLTRRRGSRRRRQAVRRRWRELQRMSRRWAPRRLQKGPWPGAAHGPWQPLRLSCSRGWSSSHCSAPCAAASASLLNAGPFGRRSSAAAPSAGSACRSSCVDHLAPTDCWPGGRSGYLQQRSPHRPPASHLPQEWTWTALVPVT